MRNSSKKQEEDVSFVFLPLQTLLGGLELLCRTHPGPPHIKANDCSQGPDGEKTRTYRERQRSRKRREAIEAVLWGGWGAPTTKDSPQPSTTHLEEKTNALLTLLASYGITISSKKS